MIIFYYIVLILLIFGFIYLMYQRSHERNMDKEMYYDRNETRRKVSKLNTTQLDDIEYQRTHDTSNFERNRNLPKKKSMKDIIAELLEL